MNARQIANTMASSMSIVQPLRPQGFPRQHVQMKTTASVGEDRRTEVEHPLQNQGKMLLLLLGQRTKRHRSGNVCRPLQIVSAGVQQQQPAGLELGLIFLCGLKVYDRPVRSDRKSVV